MEKRGIEAETEMWRDEFEYGTEEMAIGDILRIPQIREQLFGHKI